jgi:hypothetical protein
VLHTSSVIPAGTISHAQGELLAADARADGLQVFDHPTAFHTEL